VYLLYPWQHTVHESYWVYIAVQTVKHSESHGSVTERTKNKDFRSTFQFFLPLACLQSNRRFTSVAFKFNSISQAHPCKVQCTSVICAVIFTRDSGSGALKNPPSFRQLLYLNYICFAAVRRCSIACVASERKKGEPHQPRFICMNRAVFHRQHIAPKRDPVGSGDAESDACVLHKEEAAAAVRGGANPSRIATQWRLWIFYVSVSRCDENGFLIWCDNLEVRYCTVVIGAVINFWQTCRNFF